MLLLSKGLKKPFSRRLKVINVKSKNIADNIVKEKKQYKILIGPLSPNISSHPHWIVIDRSKDPKSTWHHINSICSSKGVQMQSSAIDPQALSRGYQESRIPTTVGIRTIEWKCLDALHALGGNSSFLALGFPSRSFL